MDVKTIRESLQLTQHQFAEALGVSPGLVGDLERTPPRRKLSLKTAAKLEALTGRKDIVAAVVAEKTGAAA